MQRNSLGKIGAFASVIFLALSIYLIPITMTSRGASVSTAQAAADCSGAGEVGGPPEGYTISTTIPVNDPSGGTVEREACKNAAGDTAIFAPEFASWTKVTAIGGNLAPVRGPTSCGGFWDNIASPGTCIARALFAGAASFLIYIGVECLTASGLLFEAVLKYTVVSFQTPMYASIQEPVNNAWTVFRDISNILIIGFFTFIAISTILGIAEYGAKKLLSRVLIVAVLINFSLLFTKLVIDGSNFTAYQFYSASLSNVDGAGTTADRAIASSNGAAAAQVSGNGIAGSFIQYLGVTGFADSYNAVRSAQEANDDASTGLVIGVLSFVFLMATALVFLYGSFILVTRAILFIFLLVTSSLAFATYLIPKLADNYGWSKWWAALFKNAILAPILMMMLWVTLTIASGVSGKFGPSGTLGDLAKNPTSEGNIVALLNFVIILGLLYASFRLASKFSGGIGGFNFAAMVPGLGLAMGARLAAATGRQTIGRASLYASERLQSASRKEGRSDFSRQLFDFGAQKTKGIAKRDFNALGGTIGKAIAANSGLSAGTLTGTKVGGFLGGEEAKAKAAAEQARRMAPKKEDHKENEKSAGMDQVRGNASLSKQHEEAVANHQNEQSNASAMGAALVKMTERHDQEMKQLQTVLAEAEGAGNTAGAEAAKLSILQKAAEHRTELSAQSAKIAEANSKVKAALGNIDKVVQDGTAIAKAKGLIADYKDNTNALAARLATKSFTNVLYSEAENARLAHMAEHEVGHQKNDEAMEKSGLNKLIKNAIKANASAEEATSPQPIAAAPVAQATAAGGHGDNQGGGDHTK